MKKTLLTLVSAIILCIYVFPQSPGIYISPSYLTGRLLPGNDTTVTTHLINNSGEEITFSFPDFLTRGSGGPDVYGYRWIDSDEDGIPYTWTEISSTGTEITGLGDDNRVGPFNIGFDFPYYGQTRNQYWVSSNGAILFNDINLVFYNSPIPTNTPITDFIAVLWDDLNFMNTESKAFYQQFTDKIVIQFEKVYRYGNAGYATFQVTLMPDGSVVLSYKEISPEFNTFSNTIGLQSPDGAVGLQVSYNNQDYLHNELSVLINTVIENGDFITAINPASGNIASGAQVEITLTYSAEGYEPGRYQQTVNCTTSSPGFDSLPVYNLMIVSAQPVFFGTVTDAASGAFLEGVTVTAGQYMTTTGPLGHYDLTVTPGTYSVTFEKQGYDTVVRPGFVIGLDQATEVSQALELDDDFILGGTTFAGIYQLDLGYVNAFKTIGGQVVDIFADLIDTLGYYMFPSLYIGDYLVKAEPSFGSQYTGSYLPTYYGDVVHWADASVINLTQNVFSADIHLVAASLNNSNGPGKISGYIYHSGQNKSGNSAVPAPDIQIFLKQGNNHAMTMSNSEGYFEFKKLEYGTYTMFAELFGKNSEFRNITLTQSNQSSDANDLFIYATDVLYGIGDNLPVGVKSVSQPYPNPVSNEINVSINLLQPLNMKMELLNAYGQSVLIQIHTMGPGMNEIRIPVTNLGSGIYWLKIGDESGAGISKKIIKK